MYAYERMHVGHIRFVKLQALIHAHKSNGARGLLGSAPFSRSVVKMVFDRRNVTLVIS